MLMLVADSGLRTLRLEPYPPVSEEEDAPLLTLSLILGTTSMPSAALCTKERSRRGEGADDDDAAEEEAGADDTELELAARLEADDGENEVERTNLPAKSASIFSESGTWTG